jgi:hypothetical protein
VIPPRSRMDDRPGPGTPRRPVEQAARLLMGLTEQASRLLYGAPFLISVQAAQSDSRGFPALPPDSARSRVRSVVQYVPVVGRSG